MQIIIRIVVPALIPIIIGLLLSQIDKANSKEVEKNLTKEHIVIRLPKAYMWVGCLDISVFAAFICVMTFFPNDTAEVWVKVLFGAFILLGAVLVLATLIWRIDIFRSESYFIYRASPFKSNKIQYSDCVSYKFVPNTLVLKTKEKTLQIDSHSTNLEFMLAMLTQHEIKEKIE